MQVLSVECPAICHAMLYTHSSLLFTEDVGTSEPGDLTTVKVVSTVLGLLSTAIFVLPCCVLSYFMTVKRVKRKRKEKREESDGKTPRRGLVNPLSSQAACRGCVCGECHFMYVPVYSVNLLSRAAHTHARK